MADGDFGTEHDHLNRARLTAFRETWKYARSNSAYYAKVLPDINPDTLKLSDLQRVPLFNPSLLAERRDEIRCLRTLPSFVTFTGGTAGHPRIIYQTWTESEKRQHATVPPHGTQLRRLGLSAGSDGHHGTYPGVPGEEGRLRVPLLNRKNYRCVWELLTSEHSFDGYESKITHLQIPLVALKQLVHFGLQHDYDLRRLALVLVCTNSWHLSRNWRSFLEETLQAKVLNSFGFSEMAAANTRECLECGWYHYGAQAVWEAVDPVTLEPLDDGVGRLLVTALYPHVRDHVLFRFDPGDLVELGPHCSSAGDRGFRPVGRASQSFFFQDHGRRVWVFFPTQMLELVDRDPRVNRWEPQRFERICTSSDHAFAKFNAQLVSGEVVPELRINVEVKFSPHLFPRAWDEFDTYLRNGLAELNPELKRALAEAKLGLKICGLPPGGIQRDELFLC